MIFGNIECEKTVQVNDKTRINCVKTFRSVDEPAITLVRIKPESSESFIKVSGSTINARDFYLDWEYKTDGIKTIELEVTTNGSPVIFTKTIEVVSVENDKLLSIDQDLVEIEPDILSWVSQGRNTFINIHRNSLNQILDWLDSVRIWKNDGSKLTKNDITLTDDLKQLSIYLTLQTIFMGISNKVDDVFLDKSKEYGRKAESLKARGRIQADFNDDNQVGKNESADMTSFFIYRQ